jgi:hypothetical protein
MKLLLVLLLLTGTCLRASAQPAGEGWVDLDPSQLPRAWETLLQRLRAPATLHAEFVEARKFSFRAEPVVLRGELRLHHTHGLSLHYFDPELQTIIVDDDGVLLRDSRQRSRTAPAAAVEGVGPLRNVWRLDLAELAGQFVLRGQLSDEGWQLLLEPRAGPGAGRIHLSGTEDAIRRIVLQPTPRRQVEITIGAVHRDVTFTGPEVRRFFR